MIQKIIQSLSLFFVLHASAFANATEPKPTIITCHLHNNFGQAVSLYKIENGDARRLGFRWTKNDSCVFSIPMEKEGMYFLVKSGGVMHGASFNHVIYLKPGDNKTIEIFSGKTNPDFDSCNVVESNIETKLLQQWANLVNNYCKLGMNRSQRDLYIAKYNNFVGVAEQLKKKTTQNKYFNQLFSSKIDADIKYCKLAAFFNFGERMNTTYDTNTIHKSFYQSLTNERFCDAGILHSEHGLQLLNYQLTFDIFQKTTSQEIALNTSIVDKAKLLCNDTIRGAFLTQHLMGVTNYEQLVAEIEPFKSSLVTPEMKDAYQMKLKQLNKFAKGLQAYNFSLYDNNEKLHSLSDFKGRVVVLDMWAMWCAPCLAEKPYFKKVEEEYKGRQEIIFVGVSVDGLAKKENWKDFIARKGWQGLELLSNFDESIMKYYKIDGIPRFMIFDKDGKIVTVDAPRPSTPEFKALIEQTLKSNS